VLAKFPPVINYIFYTADFIVKRVFPKLRITRWLYLLLTRGNNVVISRAEALGRLSRAGFEITNESFINNQLFIEGRKNRVPLDSNGKNYGILISLPRVGRDGKMIKVYKMRTMHPYSEYIQDYVYNLHDLQEGGKFSNDFRITSWGAFSRKVWLDELPMLINFIKGDMKIVGVRPLSKQYFNLYSEEVRKRRVKFKPGLIPPFYYHMPQNLEEIQSSEMKYLDEYERRPLRTDIRYFFVSFWNIIFRHARSN
jgi:lipopolysaccharide/colanic/teichoic acid biosynthesis glycosyltransferase